MGELILCNQMLAALPYYIDNASINVYSLEELCYYIENNVYLLEPDFMNEELCNWISKELNMFEVADQLREICRQNGTLSEFVTCILKQSGYLRPNEIARIAQIRKEMESKSDYECGKMKADRYVENHRYISAIYEYRRLIEMEEQQNEVLTGNVWHNLGKAYAGLFLFQEAAVCLRRAYELNQNPESLRECLYACRCMRDEKNFRMIAKEGGLSEEECISLGRELTELSRMDDIKAFEEQVSELFEMGSKTEIYQMVDNWKDIYRKNCRI